MATIDLTEAEIRGLMLEASLDPGGAGTMLKAFEGMDDEALRAALGQAISGSASPEAVAGARALAERQSRKIFGDLARAEINKIGKIVSDGLAEGLGPRDIARLLDPVKGLDPARASRYRKLEKLLELSDRSDAEIKRMLDSEFNRLLRARKNTIARTEARFATSDANRVIAESRGQQHKAWITAGDDRVDDSCEANEAQGWIPIKDAFQSGNEHPPEHPNCRCSVTYRTAPPTDAANARVEARAAQTAAAKEAA